jgi:putative DNA primase/helicase
MTSTWKSTLGKNPGKDKALEAAHLVEGRAVFPVFAPDEQVLQKLTDFNDLANKSALGIEAVKRQVGSVVNNITQTSMKNQAQARLQENETVKSRALVR